MALINFVMPCFLHFWNQTEIFCVVWELYVESAMSACVAHHPWKCSKNYFRWHLMQWLSWRGGVQSRTGLESCRLFPTTMTWGFSAILHIFLLGNERVYSLQADADTCYQSGIFPCSYTFKILPGPKACFTLFPSQSRWYSCWLALSRSCVFMFQFCKIGKHFKGTKHNLLEGWEEGTWHREAE